MCSIVCVGGDSDWSCDVEYRVVEIVLNITAPVTISTISCDGGDSVCSIVCVAVMVEIVCVA